VLEFERQNRRSPAQEFLGELQRPIFTKFSGQFRALVVDQGAKYSNQQRFWPLHGKAKPLWEFKEKNHRLYCLRRDIGGGSVMVVLFNGWVKDKKKNSDREPREIQKALDLLAEFLAELPEGEEV